MTTDSATHHFSKDGSSTLYSNQFGQFYHNPNGAVSESNHVFFDVPNVDEALKRQKDSLTFFEVGFGTGLNLLLLMDRYLEQELTIPVYFYSVEAFPVSKEVAEKFNFGNFLSHPELQQIIPDIFGMLKPGMNSFNPLPRKNFQVLIFQGYFDELTDIEQKADFIFHDAFSPEVNPELWTVECFKKLASLSSPKVMLSTYCAASKARAAMAKAGWKLAKAQGALGKREMTVASVNDDQLSHLKKVNEARLIERFDSGEFDDNLRL